jgi:hypothetical protein
MTRPVWSAVKLSEIPVCELTGVLDDLISTLSLVLMQRHGFGGTEYQLFRSAELQERY